MLIFYRLNIQAKNTMRDSENKLKRANSFQSVQNYLNSRSCDYLLASGKFTK